MWVTGKGCKRAGKAENGKGSFLDSGAKNQGRGGGGGGGGGLEVLKPMKD